MIVRGMRQSRINAAELAERVGKSRSWASRVLSGAIGTMDDDTAERVAVCLGITWREPLDKEKASAAAAALSKIADQDERVAGLLSTIQELVTPIYQPRYYETKEMTRLGQEIVRIAFANEDKPGKVAREVLALLSDIEPLHS